MIVYNITAKVTWSIAEPWLQWEKEEHIPEMMHTGLIESYKLYQLLEQDEEDGATYTIQFFFVSWGNYETYLRVFAPALREKSQQLWGNQFIAFRTVMKLVN